jgi:CRP-like cAMP-binding protein
MGAPRPRPHDLPKISNRLLASLPKPEQARLASHLNRVQLKQNQVLQRQGELIDRVWFPDSGAISLVTIMDDGKSVEVGTVGNEGVVGIHGLYGSARMPCDALVVIRGEARMLMMEDLHRETRPGDPLADLLDRYSHALLIQTMQTAACNGLHSITQRAAHNILTLHDRTELDPLPLTHEVLATLLGVRRSSVTVVARSLQASGAIDYRHGNMVIRNRLKLESACCECYKVVQEHFRQLLPCVAGRTKDDAETEPRRSQILTQVIPVFI